MEIEPVTFEYEVTVGDEDTPVPFPPDLSRASKVFFQIENTGEAALTSLKLQTSPHPNAHPVNSITNSGQWVPGALIADLFTNPYNLPAGEYSTILLNCHGLARFIFTATCATETTLVIRGTITPLGA